MAFEELIARLRDSGDSEIPPTIYDDLTAEYTTAVSGAAARIAEKDSMIMDHEAEIARLKAKNFDLLMAAAAESKPEKVDEIPEETQVTIESLFNR